MSSFRISRLEPVCLSPRSGEMSGGSFPQDLFHRLPFRELIDQLVQIPYFFYQRICYFLHAHTTHDAFDERTTWMNGWCLSKERLEVAFLFDLLL